MPCEFLHKQCGKDCDNHLCGAFFPKRQPVIMKSTKDICQGEDYATECLIYGEAIEWREERRLKGLTEKCPFASNTRCGRPWEWWCKGSNYPFKLTPFEVREGTDDIPVRAADRNIKFITLKTDTGEDFDLHKTCLSGDPSIYTTCPHYKLGMEVREEWRKLKSKETNKESGNIVD